MKIVRYFSYSAATILLLTAAAKFVSSTGHGEILLQLDPLTGLKFRELFCIAGGVEAGVALFCFLSRDQIWLQTIMVVWLATSFLAYRIGLVLVGWHKPCSCLGNLTDALHIPPQTADTAMKIILAYLLLGSYATLFWLWRQKRKGLAG